MTKFSDNDSPSLLFTEQGSTPTTPAASHQRLFIRTSDHLLCYVNSSGTVTPVDTGFANPLTTTGDIIYSSSGTTAARRGIGSTGDVLTVAGGVPTWAAPSTGITHTTLGTTSVGATGFRSGRGAYVKKVTMASAGVISAIWAHIKGDGSTPIGIAPVIFSDTAAAPINLIYGPPPVITSSPTHVLSMILNTTARWAVLPVGGWFASGDYWIGFFASVTNSGLLSLAYASGGSDQTQSNAAEQNEPTDSSVQAFTAAAGDNYSIYCDVLR